MATAVDGGDLDAVNLTAAGGNSSTIIVCSPAKSSLGSLNANANATILGAITTEPHNISVLAVGGLIMPSGFDIVAFDSETRTFLVVNITRVLTDVRGFNMITSMLEASGVADDFDADERGADITIFVPTDDAFAALPATDRLQSLPTDRKGVMLRFHVQTSR